MAIGIALLFNIKLPINFNSPYKATNIQDFWRRWHITLSRFLRDYIYIPLGGNRIGRFATYYNVMIRFILYFIFHKVLYNNYINIFQVYAYIPIVKTRGFMLIFGKIVNPNDN